MKEKLRECRDVEELSYTHIQYTSSLQYQCLLNEKVLLLMFTLSTIYNSVMDILGLGTSFVEKYIQLKGEVLPTKKTQRRYVRMGSISDDEDTEMFVQESATEEEFVEFVGYLDDRFFKGRAFYTVRVKGKC